MNRVDFLKSVSGINYPEMIINFFDQFIALKQLVEDSGTINVLDSTQNSISFSISFKNENDKNLAVQAIQSLGGTIVIYERIITITMIPTDNYSIKITLQ